MPRSSAGTAAGSPSPGALGASAPTDAGGQAAAGPGSRYAAGRPGRRAAARTRGGPSPEIRRADRRVRTLVRRFSGCLGRLDDRAARVLRMRAGVGPRDALSRRRVAARLHLPVRRVSRLERRGVRRLEALSRTGSCGGAGGSTASAGERAIAAPDATGASGAARTASGEDTATPLVRTRQKIGVAARSASVIGHDDHAARGSRSPAIIEAARKPSIAALILGVLGLLCLAVAIRRERRDARR